MVAKAVFKKALNQGPYVRHVPADPIEPDSRAELDTSSAADSRTLGGKTYTTASFTVEDGVSHGQYNDLITIGEGHAYLLGRFLTSNRSVELTALIVSRGRHVRLHWIAGINAWWPGAVDDNKLPDETVFTMNSEIV